MLKMMLNSKITCDYKQGLRFDYNNQYKSKISPKISILYKSGASHTELDTHLVIEHHLLIKNCTLIGVTKDFSING